MLKKVDEAWLTEDVCVKGVCAFDTNGNPVIKTQREACNTICQPVSQAILIQITPQQTFIILRDTSLSQYRTNAAVNA